MRFGSVCSGIEAASVAFEPLGWKAAWFSEIEPFPRAVLAHHWPDVPNYGDMTKLPERILSGEIEAPEMLCGGTPCFTAGQMVLTESGYKPIEEIQVGELVMTHKGRLRKVLKVGNKKAKVGKLEAIGHRAITCTPNHPFLSIYYTKRVKRQNGKSVRVPEWTAPEWVPASELPESQWLSLTKYENTDNTIKTSKLNQSQDRAMFLVGMYVGDGYIRKWKGRAKKAVVLCINEQKLQVFKEKFYDISATISRQKTAIKVTICDSELADWLLENFGEHSSGKRVPSWVLGHSLRKHFLDGYLLTDGSATSYGYTLTTNSHSVGFGVADLFNTLGYAATCKYVIVPETCVIEGRVCHQNNKYQVRAYQQNISRKSRLLDGWLCRTVISFKNLPDPEIVYNIEVEEDHSYILEGAVVHNCQAFSVAGQRKSLDDDRGNLSLVFCEIANAIDTVRTLRGHQPAIVFWENVPGVLNTKDNAFGCFLAGLVGANAPLESGTDGNKWPTAGYVAGPQRQVAWRTLDAQYHGVPQRRRRVFVVASARTDFDPSKVLFESPCVSGDFESSREARQGSTSGSEECARSTGYREGSFGQFVESELAGTAKASGGVLGGGVRNLNNQIVGTLTACDLMKGSTNNQSISSGLLIVDEDL